MIDRSEAYKTLIQQSEDLFNFILLVCISVPNLEKVVRYIQDEEEGFSTYQKIKTVENVNSPNEPLKYKLAKSIHFPNDSGIERVSRIFHFKRNVKNDEWGHRAILENSLSKYVLLSSFSFFEAYFQNLISEVIQFHGGESAIINTLKQKITKFNPTDSKLVKLKTPFDKGKINKFEKYHREIEQNGFVFPSEIFALQGIKRLSTFTKDSSNFKASKIPDILNDLLFDVEKIWDVKEENPKSIRQKLDEIRDWRNDIAHGNQEKTTSSEFRLDKILRYNNFLKKLSNEIDTHFLEHFFIVDINLRN